MFDVVLFELWRLVKTCLIHLHLEYPLYTITTLVIKIYNTIKTPVPGLKVIISKVCGIEKYD